MLCMVWQNADGVGVLDTATNVFETIVLVGVTTTSQRFRGATTSGTKVYFAPYVSRAQSLVRLLSCAGMGAVVSGATVWGHRRTVGHDAE